MKTKRAAAADLVIGCWPLLLFVSFVWTLSPPVVTVGYNWLGELSLSIFLLVSLVFLAFGKSFGSVLKISRPELIWIILPVALFTLWSGLSCFWAASPRNALHHTLLWGCYLVFYVLIRNILRSEETLTRCVNLAGWAVIIISSICLVEFAFTPNEEIPALVPLYYPYTEFIASFLPLLIAFAIDGTVRNVTGRMIGIALAWCAVVIVASRAMFLAGVIGILTFVSLSFGLHRRAVNTKRLFVFVAIVAAITICSHWILKADLERGLFQRFAGTNVANVNSANLRLIYWEMAIDAFKMNPVAGLGGDNYFSEYKLLRQRYAAAHPEDRLLELYEEAVPERAHNEYLQMLSELGSVGAALFGWLLVGIAYMMLLAFRKRSPLVTFGALAGVAAFMAASFVSSYSFRVPVNGVGFFFLIAVAARELFPSDPQEESVARRPAALFVFAGLVVASAMLALSAVRAVSLNYLAHFQNTQNRAYAVAEIKKAIALDPSEPTFRFSYGQELFFAGRRDPRNYDEAISNFRLAIDNGLATSPVYFNLLGAEMHAGKLDQAEETFQEALSVYPRSVFLRTAHVTFLRLQGDLASANIEYSKALAVDAVQTRSWQLAHDEGLETLAGIAKTDSQFLDPNKLLPINGPTALRVFQQQPSSPKGSS